MYITSASIETVISSKTIKLCGVKSQNNVQKTISVAKKTCIRIRFRNTRCQTENCVVCAKIIRHKTKSKGNMKNSRRNFNENVGLYDDNYPDDMYRHYFDEPEEIIEAIEEPDKIKY